MSDKLFLQSYRGVKTSAMKFHMEASKEFDNNYHK